MYDRKVSKGGNVASLSFFGGGSFSSCRLQCGVAVVLCSNTHNGPFSGTTQVGRYQKGKTSLDFTEARDSEWQWHQLGHMQVCTSLQTDNHASTPPLSFLQARCPSCRPTNSVKSLTALLCSKLVNIIFKRTQWSAKAESEVQ